MRWPALLTVLLLSGCAGSGPTSSTTTAATAPAATGLAVPVLHVGDWWNFTSPTGALSYVVSGESATEYTFDTDSSSLAFFNAQSDVSTLGPIRKADLAGSQGDGR